AVGKGVRDASTTTRPDQVRSAGGDCEPGRVATMTTVPWAVRAPSASSSTWSSEPTIATTNAARRWARNEVSRPASRSSPPGAVLPGGLDRGGPPLPPQPGARPGRPKRGPLPRTPPPPPPPRGEPVDDRCRPLGGGLERPPVGGRGRGVEQPARARPPLRL